MLIDPEVPKVDRVYSRNVQEDYWSGYRHQPCVVMDDIGNYTEGKDAEDIMKMFSPSPFLLEMAAVEEKGTAFSSRLVLMTANMDFPTTTKVKDLKALWRRRNYCVQMKMYRDDDIPDSERTRPQPTEFLDDMSHAYFIRFQPDIKSATGDIVPIGTPMSYDEFLDDVINDYERFVKNRYTPTDNIKAKIAARNQSLVTRGVNAIKQAGEYIWHELRKDADFGDYAYLKESTVKVFDPLTEEEVIPPPQWERCCKHPGCALPAAFIIHTHERHSWQEVKGTRIDNLKDQEVIKCENELHPSWVRFYPKINPRNLSQSSIPTTGEYHYYFFDKNVTIWDCTSTWYERTFDGRGAIRWLGDHFIYIYLGLCVAGVISQMIFQIYSAYQDAKRNEEQALEAKMRRKVLEMQAKETKQASSMVSPGTSEVHIRSKRFNKPRDLAERQALDEAVAEMTTYAAQNDVKYIAEVLNSEHELVQKEKWCKQMELIEEIEYYFTEEWRPEIELDEALAPLWDGSNSDEAFEKLKIHLVGRYMTALDALDDMKRMIKTADDFLVNAAVFGSARDHILLCTALLQRKDLIDSWKQIGIQLEADYPENAAFITRLKRVLLGGHDYVKLAETEQAFEKGIAMAKGRKQRIKTEPREFKMANPVMEHEEGQSTSNGKKKKKTSEEKQSDDPNADQLADRFFKSMVKITVTSETDDKDLEYSQTVNGVGVRGQFLLIPRHVFCGRDGQLLTIGHDNKCKCGYAGHQHKVKIEAWWSASQFADVIFDPRNISTLKAAYGGEDSDMVIFYCGPRMAPFKDNTEHFLQADDIERLSRFQVTITTLRYATDGWRPAYVETEAAPLTKKVSYFLSAKNEREEGTEDEIKDLRQMNGWEYAAPMQKGDCGAPIICKSTKMIKKMIGIHVSLGRAAATGYGEVVLKERLMDALNELIERRGLVNSVRQGLTNIPDLEEVPETMRIPEGNFTILGRLPPAKAPRMAQETNLRKSVVYGKVHEATCEPAILTPTDPRAARLGKGYAPMWNNVKKFGSRTEEFHPERLAQAADFIKSELFYHMDKPQHQRRVCTEDEVINGNFGFGWESMDLDTSPGFQWTKGRKAGETGKRHLFTEIEGQKMVKNILLRQTLDEMEDEMRRGIMTKNLWTCTLKDEKREKWKVALGKTRVFIAAPITFTMLCRKYTLAFSSAFIEARLDIPSAVGINAFSSDWNRMITILEQNGQATIAGVERAYLPHPCIVGYNARYQYR